MNQQSHECRGWVKGLSMWPNLIPGDILRAEECQAQNLKPGMIAVFAAEGGEHFIVHRVVSVRISSDNTVVQSAGDRSGLDEGQWRFISSDHVTMVTGVLRRGKYHNVGSLSIPMFLSPSLLVRIYCGIVRKLFW
ncbi:MAG: hypothetical protein GQ565_11350 [Candidatus Aegiribacteria sp.]|nr:hypothetical protein [Candidatus Aegiribacteria sp.]